MPDELNIESYVRALVRDEVARCLSEQSSTEDVWLTAKEVSGLTKLSEWSVRELNRRGVLVAETYGKRGLRWRKQVVDKFIKNGLEKYRKN